MTDDGNDRYRLHLSPHPADAAPPQYDPATGRVDLGPSWTTAEYEEGYVHFHVSQSLGGRGNAAIYLKLCPHEARAVAMSLLDMADDDRPFELQQDEDGEA